MTTKDRTNCLELEQRHGIGVYPVRGITLVRGEGARVFDDEGRSWIDCIGGHGAAVLGHAHPALVRAVSEQVTRLVCCPGSFANDMRARALSFLSDVTGFDRFFLANSGTEAIEGAIKIARIVTGRTKIIAVRQGFHGRTIGALAVTWDPKYREPFAPLMPDVEHIPLNDVDAATHAIDDRTAAIIVEPIQGEGGVRPARPDWLAHLRERCDSTSSLLILDEIQTGFGRTGKWFAHHHVAIGDRPLKPDLLTMAKGIAGGIPMGAIAVGAKITGLPQGSHGSTFGGNPLACAACIATLETLENDELPERARLLGEYAFDILRRRLAHVPVVKEIRGLGLMIGIELRTRVTPLLKTLADRGVLALGAGPTVLRLLPPLVIAEADWHSALDTIIETLGSVGEDVKETEASS